MQLVWDAKLEPMQKLVLVAMADNANDEGECWPSVPYLARKTGAGTRTVQRAIIALDENGHLTRIEEPGKVCHYRIHPRQSDTPQGEKRGRQDDTPPPSDSRSTPVTATGDPRQSDGRTVKNRHSTVREPTARARGALDDAGQNGNLVGSGVPEELWRDFREHRCKIKAPMTDRAEKAILKRLEEFKTNHGDDPSQVLEQSIRKGWRDVFPLKADGDAARAGNLFSGWTE
jgi:hypothetical protein